MAKRGNGETFSPFPGDAVPDFSCPIPAFPLFNIS